MSWGQDYSNRERYGSICSSTNSSDIDEVESNLYGELYFDHGEGGSGNLVSDGQFEVDLVGDAHPSSTSLNLDRVKVCINGVTDRRFENSSYLLSNSGDPSLEISKIVEDTCDLIKDRIKPDHALEIPFEMTKGTDSCNDFVSKLSSSDDDSVIIEDDHDITIIAHYGDRNEAEGHVESIITVSDSSDSEFDYTGEWSVKKKSSYTRKFLNWHKEIAEKEDKLKFAQEKMRHDYDSDSSTEFDLNKLQNDMPESGWSLEPRDLYLNRTYRYHSQPNIKCGNCQQYGHHTRSCPDPVKILKCYICGETNHSGYRCPNRKCPRCFGPKHHHYCPVSWNDVCSVCNCPGHETNNCPDLWRRYHVTTSTSQDLDIIRTPPPKFSKMKPRIKQFCYNCSRQGHFGFECNSGNHGERQCSWPFIVSYSNPIEHLKSLGIKVSLQTPPTLVLPCLIPDANSQTPVFEEIVELKSDKVGRLIGRSGSNIKSLSEKSGAKLEVVNVNKGEQYYIHMVGSGEQVKGARELLEQSAGRSLKRINSNWANPQGMHRKKVRFDEWFTQNDLIALKSVELSKQTVSRVNTSSKNDVPLAQTSIASSSSSWFTSQTNRTVSEQPPVQSHASNSKQHQPFLSVLLYAGSEGDTEAPCGCCYYIHRVTNPCRCVRDYHVTLPRAKSQILAAVYSTLNKAKSFPLNKMSMVLKKMPPLLEQLTRKVPALSSKGSRDRFLTCVKRINMVYYGTFRREGVIAQLVKDLSVLKKSADSAVPDDIRERLLNSYGKMTSGHNCVGVIDRLNYLMSQGVGLKLREPTSDSNPNPPPPKNHFRITAQELILDRRCMELVPAKLVNVRAAMVDKYGLWPIKNEYYTDHQRRAAAEELNKELRILFESNTTQVKLTKDERIYLGKLVLKVLSPTKGQS